MARYRGTGVITAADFKASVKWVGKTKGGKAVTIKLLMPLIWALWNGHTQIRAKS